MIDYVIFIILAACIGAWLAMAYHHVRSMMNIKPDTGWAFWLNPFVHYRETAANRHLNEAGRRHTPRRNAALKVILAACGLLALAMLSTPYLA